MAERWKEAEKDLIDFALAKKIKKKRDINKNTFCKALSCTNKTELRVSLLTPPPSYVPDWANQRRDI